MARFTLNQRQVKDLFETIEEMPKYIIEEGYDYFKSITPKDTGNARRQTKVKVAKGFDTRGNKIEAKYPYAGRLDEGWSKQARNGMSDPTIKKMEDFAEKFIKDNL
jgi:hypothetical protein